MGMRVYVSAPRRRNLPEHVTYVATGFGAEHRSPKIKRPSQFEERCTPKDGRTVAQRPLVSLVRSFPNQCLRA
jgi:hypothetical protein